MRKRRRKPIETFIQSNKHFEDVNKQQQTLNVNVMIKTEKNVTHFDDDDDNDQNNIRLTHIYYYCE